MITYLHDTLDIHHHIVAEQPNIQSLVKWFYPIQKVPTSCPWLDTPQLRVQTLEAECDNHPITNTYV
jgi:hypothetical protein